MRSKCWSLLIGLMTLTLLMACGGPVEGHGTEVQINLQAQFEKRPLTPTGFGTTVLRPVRYCWADVMQQANGAWTIYNSVLLDSQGRGLLYAPQGQSVFIRVTTEYEVPASDPASFFMAGDVRNAPLPLGDVTESTFKAFPIWDVQSDAFTANQNGNLTLTALISNLRAGAFNIADQAITFAATIRNLNASPSLRLPNLHTFWTTSANPNDQTRTYPALTWTPSNAPLVFGGRARFSHGVYGINGGANTETDEWDDGVLQETFVRLLFADYSSSADGSSSRSLLRRDNDNVWVDRTVQSESTLAFVAGFSDFLSAAIRSDSRILDSYVDGSAVARVDAFDLTDHAYVPVGNKGEFSRGSIAISLWGLWKNVLGGESAGLNTLWEAVRSTTTYPNGTGEYEEATLACFPTYLQGVANRINASAWNIALGELALESVSNPDATYFNGTTLWQTRSTGFSEAGSLQTYAATSNIYYDRNQSQAWRFTHGGGARTITMTPTSGQDFYLELIGPGGLVDGSYDPPVGQRRLFIQDLPAGVYVARVRAGETTATGMNTYTITVN